MNIEWEATTYNKILKPLPDLNIITDNIFGINNDLVIHVINSNEIITIITNFIS